MLPDAVTIGVVVRIKGGEPKLFLNYEYRYPVGQYLLSPIAGLIDPKDKDAKDPLITAASGYELVSVEEAKKLFSTGRDKYGNFFSLATYMVLACFIMENHHDQRKSI